jgi:transposase
MMQEAEDGPLFAERAAGIDIAKTGIEVTIRVPSDTRRGGRQQETRSFRTVRKDLLALADWLRCWQVAKVGMESTGDYWKPVYFLLEREGLDCVLYHAAQVKALPGRPKTDKADSVWLAKITERGSLPGSFVPPEEIRRLRTHTRYRRHLTQARTAEKARVEKLLEDAHLKLSSVISASMASPAGPCWRPSPPGSVTPGHSRSWPAAPCAARSPGSKRPSTAPS